MSDQRWDAAFDQADIDLLRSAFARACRLTERNCELGSLETSDARKLIARRIIAVAGGGERSVSRLADEAVAYLRQHEQVRRSMRSVAARNVVPGAAA